MRETYLDLPSRLEDAFSEIDNDIMIELRNEKEEYAELLQKISDLKQKAPFLTDLLESSGEIRLTAKEYAAFTQYLHLVRQRDDMERQQIYFRGHTDADKYCRKAQIEPDKPCALHLRLRLFCNRSWCMYPFRYR